MRTGLETVTKLFDPTAIPASREATSIHPRLGPVSVLRLAIRLQ